MIERFAKSLKTFLNELHESRKTPYKNIQKWLSLQLKILKKLRYLEGKIRGSKRIIAQLKRNLKTPALVKTKAEAQSIKTNIKVQAEKIEDYKFMILCFKSIADGIAFTFINKFDIKPQNFKETPGFITGKEGLKTELKTLKFIYKNGRIAILNDLTTVLKYNDLSILTSENFISVEMKSSELDTTRIQRQKIKSQKLFKYLDTGETNELYGFEGSFSRQSMEIPEKIYAKQLNSIISKSREKGMAHKVIEPGLIYLVCHSPGNIQKELDMVNKKCKLAKPLFHSLNCEKFPGEGYYPLSLSLYPDNYLGFLMGNFIILIILDLKHIEDISIKNGFIAKYVQDKDWVLEFYSSEGAKTLVMSYHLLGRIFTEFSSPKQMIEDGFLQYHRMVKQDENAHNIGFQQLGLKE